MGNLSWTRAIILGLIPGGQLYERIVNYGASMDKWWLLLPAFFPPFSLIPMILLKMGIVSINSGPGFINPLNWWLLIPIFTMILLPILLNNVFNLDDDSMLGFLITLICVIGASTVTNLINFKKKCNTINHNIVGKAVIDATVAYGAAIAISWCINLIPILDEIIIGLEMIPGIGTFVKQGILIFGYIIGLFIIGIFNLRLNVCTVSWQGTTVDKILLAASSGMIFMNFLL